MRPTADVLARLAAEATPVVVGLEVRALVDTLGGGHLLLLAEAEGERLVARLLVCTEGPRARLHLAPPRRPPKPKPLESAFTRDAHAPVEGTRILAVDVKEGDRTVTVRLATADGAERRLVAELFGNAPNILLVDEEGVVRALKRRRKGARPLAVGRAYVAPSAAPPPPADAIEPEYPAPAPSDDPSFTAAHPFSAAVDATFHPLDEAAARDEATVQVAAALKRARAKAEKLAEQLERQVAAGEEATRCRHHGDLLSAAFGRVRRGLTELEVDDFEGGRETVPLDPKLDAKGNIEACYRRARKLERAAGGARDRLAEAREKAAELVRVHEAFRAARAAGEPIPEEALRLAAPRGRAADRPSRRPGRRAPDPFAGLRRFTLRSGHQVLVGKSNRDNDRLTLRVARGNDVWMHVHGDAGSHVVLRVERDRPPSLDDLLDAASLAVHFSKRRGAARVEVTYTPRKFVRKRKGMPAGAVEVERFKTLVVEDAAERARPLLETRPPSGPDGPDSLGRAGPLP